MSGVGVPVNFSGNSSSNDSNTDNSNSNLLTPDEIRNKRLVRLNQMNVSNSSGDQPISQNENNVDVTNNIQPIIATPIEQPLMNNIGEKIICSDNTCKMEEVISPDVIFSQIHTEVHEIFDLPLQQVNNLQYDLENFSSFVYQHLLTLIRSKKNIYEYFNSCNSKLIQYNTQNKEAYEGEIDLLIISLSHGSVEAIDDNKLVQQLYEFLLIPNVDIKLSQSILESFIIASKTGLLLSLFNLHKLKSMQNKSNDYKPYFSQLVQLLQFPILRDYFVTSNLFILPQRKLNGIFFETNHYLGVFLGQSPYILATLFQNLDYRNVKSDQSIIFSEFRTLSSLVNNLFTTLLKVNKDKRHYVTEYINNLLLSNTSRTKEYNMFNSDISDHFALYTINFLLGLCYALFDPNSKYGASIQFDILLTDNAIHTSNFDYLNQFVPSPTNLCSSQAMNYFNSLLLAMHICYTPIVNRINMLQRQINYMGNQDTHGVTEARKNQMVANLLKMECMIFEPQFHNKYVLFINFTCQKILNIWDINSPNFTPQDIQINDTFRKLPLYILDDIYDSVLLCSQKSNIVFNTIDIAPILHLSIYLLYSNVIDIRPHICGKVTDAIYYLFTDNETLHSQSLYDHGKTQASSILFLDEVSIKYLCHSLIKSYGVVEKTGVYDSLSHRILITKTLQQVLSNENHQNTLRNLSSLNSDFFIDFANGLLNQINYISSESIPKIPEITALETALSTQQLTSEERDEKTNNLHEIIEKLKNFLVLLNDTLHLFTIITLFITEPFISELIKDRFANTLLSLLEVLLGPSAEQYNILNPERINYKPMTLFIEIMNIFINFIHTTDFIEAVSRSGYYNSTIFDHIVSVLQSNQQLNKDIIEQFKKFNSTIKKSYEKLQNDNITDIPEKYLDPIYDTIMKDPVQLPCGKVMDRSIIEQHLLNQQNDPFTRAYLNKDMLTPMPDLKREIEEFLLTRGMKK